MDRPPAPRRILAAAVAAALLLPPPAGAQTGPATPGQPAPPGGVAATNAAPAAAPTDEAVAIAVADLARAAGLADAAARAGAVARNAGLSSPKVVKALARFLKDKDSAVRLAALDALGRTGHADALKELHRALSSDGKLRANDQLLAALLKGIGRHGSRDSLKVLAADAWKSTDDAVVQARLYAVGRIRSKDAVAQLMDLMNTDPTVPWEQSPYMQHFRVALAALTGIDKGADKDAWRAWWREAGKSLKLDKTPPRLPSDLQQRWDAFWELPPAGA